MVRKGEALEPCYTTLGKSLKLSALELSTEKGDGEST